MIPLNEIEPAVDAGIAQAVRVLIAGGVETFESCEGGPGHAFTEPTVRFHGHADEGYRALSVAMRGGLEVIALRRSWPLVGNELTGPWWELVFRPATAPPAIKEPC